MSTFHQPPLYIPPDSELYTALGVDGYGSTGLLLAEGHFRTPSGDFMVYAPEVCRTLCDDDTVTNMTVDHTLGNVWANVHPIGHERAQWSRGRRVRIMVSPLPVDLTFNSSGLVSHIARSGVEHHLYGVRTWGRIEDQWLRVGYCAARN
jgi:hypothetical protein